MLKIDPFDTLFFRDGKPFTMGADSAAEGVFPPYPSTLFGAVRSAIIAQTHGLPAFLNEKLKTEIGTKDSYATASIEIKAVFLYREENIWFPAPLDLVGYENKEKKTLDNVCVLRLQDAPPFISNQQHSSYLIAQSDDLNESAGYFFSENSLANYLNGAPSGFDLLASQIFYQNEPKIGIKKNRDIGTTEESHLYRLEMCRLAKKTSLVCDILGIPSLATSGVLKFGGENRVVAYTMLDKQLPECLACRNDVIERIKQTRRFKLYFVTPAIFSGDEAGKGAWRPNEKFLPSGVRFLTAAVGKAVSIGGWDVQRKSEKAMRKAIPAGSVYYYQIDDTIDPAVLYDELNYKNFSEQAHEGFGLVLVGGV